MRNRSLSLSARTRDIFSKMAAIPSLLVRVGMCSQPWDLYLSYSKQSLLFCDEMTHRGNPQSISKSSSLHVGFAQAAASCRWLAFHFASGVQLLACILKSRADDCLFFSRIRRFP